MKFYNRKFLFFMMFIGIAAMVAACSKADTFAKINTDPNGAAIRGFDAVAYFAVDKAVEGSPQYEVAWNGAKWLFSSKENMEKFKANPENYAPQYGGYCSYAVSEGYTANGDPEAWKVVEGKLYLNYDKEVKQKWERAQDERIKKAEKNWVEFEKRKPEHKG